MAAVPLLPDGHHVEPVDYNRLVNMLAQLAPQTFSDTLENGTATSATVYASRTNIGTAPCDLTMIVTAHLWLGFSGAGNQVTLTVGDQASANITLGPSTNVVVDTIAGKWQGASAVGVKTYTKGDTMGYVLAYAVSASNIYIRSGTVVSFHAR